MHKNSFHNCSMTIFNYLKVVRDLNQKSMTNRLLIYTRLFLFIFGSYPCYWTVFSWRGKKKPNQKHVYSVGTYSLKTLFCLGPAQSCGGTETGRKWCSVCKLQCLLPWPINKCSTKMENRNYFIWISWCKISLVCCLQNTINSILWKYTNIGTV